MIMRAGFLGVLVIATAASITNAADVYRWKDSQGNTVISDRPPENGIEYDVLSSRSGRTIETPPAPPTATPEPQEPASPAEKQAEAPREISQFSAPKKDPKLCEQARSNLQILEDRARIRFTDDEGVVRFMDDDEREIEKDKTRDAIAAYCD